MEVRANVLFTFRFGVFIKMQWYAAKYFLGKLRGIYRNFYSGYLGYTPSESRVIRDQ